MARRVFQGGYVLYGWSSLSFKTCFYLYYSSLTQDTLLYPPIDEEFATYPLKKRKSKAEYSLKEAEVISL